MYIIYKCTNEVTGMSYIGLTKKTLKERKNQHLSESRSGNTRLLYRVLREYGASEFSWVVLDVADTSEEACRLEKHYIREYNTFENGYNLTSGGEGGKEISDSTKILLSERQVGTKNHFHGKKHSEETLEKMRQKRRSFHADMTPEAKKAMYDKSQETRRRNREKLDEGKKEKKKRGPRKVGGKPFMSEKHEIDDYTYVSRTSQSGDTYQFRTRKDGKYIRKSLKTKNLDKALAKARELYIEIHE